MSFISELRENWNWKRVKRNFKYLIKYDLEDEKYQIKDETIEDCIYEFDELKQSLVHLNVLNETQTVEILSKNPKSFCRYGDGEVNLMKGRSSSFQDYHPELARKMKEILVRKRDNLYVGLNYSYFTTPTKYSDRNRKFYRLNGTAFRRFFNEVCDPENTYLDACCFGGYFRQGSSFDIDSHFAKVRALFKEKKLTIVCGKGILDSMQFDIFGLASSKDLIDAPKKNAFSEYASLIKRITSSTPKDHLICIILGMTATVLAADLADLGYTAWDIGHAAKDYDAYMRKIEKTDSVQDKFFAPD